VFPVVEEVDQVAQDVFVEVAIGGGQGVDFYQEEVLNKT
jgi:hypothetical protein